VLNFLAGRWNDTLEPWNLLNWVAKLGEFGGC
jgi:hypothetical protein